MKKNVGKFDMVVRIILAITIAVAGIYYHSWWGLLALIPLITGLTRFCGLYSIFGISTKCSKKE
ncbi:YgaP family membrane protein [Tenuifilum thalassicum]|uniref:DUF2892 domain-containing protein n=1 Tax=Tenuifilum thalassicum TaxID=2590900 RepID=A0A7D4BFF9_9BACT|nr:DUF2892 domain-containing protein [Tenuifilum thalassicum]QKG80658.1 DUF2892 domain-containing protein [Tenuifilum thalassicum]